MKASWSEVLNQIYQDVLKKEINGDDGGFSDFFLCNKCFDVKANCRIIMDSPGMKRVVFLLCKNCIKRLIDKKI